MSFWNFGILPARLQGDIAQEPVTSISSHISIDCFYTLYTMKHQRERESKRERERERARESESESKRERERERERDRVALCVLPAHTPPRDMPAVSPLCLHPNRVGGGGNSREHVCVCMFVCRCVCVCVCVYMCVCVCGGV